jgi:hypothetical protein
MVVSGRWRLSRSEKENGMVAASRTLEISFSKPLLIQVHWGYNVSKKYTNEVIYHESDVCIIDVSTDKFPNARMKIQSEDWDYLKGLGIGRISAHTPSRSRSIYGQCGLYGKKVKVHRLLINDHETVDHIDGDGLNNLRSNLRGCSFRENNLNKPVQSRSFTGIRGVSWSTSRGQWVSKIYVNGKSKWLGRFDNIDIAIGARLQAEKQYFGEFAYGVN